MAVLGITHAAGWVSCVVLLIFVAGAVLLLFRLADLEADRR